MTTIDQDLRYIEQLDASSFRQLMETYGQEVWNLAYLITKKRDMADDIAQEVFIKAYRGIAAFRGASSIKTWLLVMTRNTAISYKRSAFLRKVTLVDRIAERGGNPSAEQEALANQFSDDIWLEVLKLPLKLREALLLHAQFELTTKEIAELLQVTEGTVRSRLFRARKYMMRNWKEAAAYE